MLAFYCEFYSTAFRMRSSSSDLILLRILSGWAGSAI